MPSPEVSRFGRESALFGEILVTKRVITQEQLRECVEEQARSENGSRTQLGQILIRKGYINTRQLVTALREQERYMIQCPTCSNRYNMLEHGAGDQIPCGDCGTTLRVPVSPLSPYIDRRTTPGVTSSDLREDLGLPTEDDSGALIQLGRYKLIEKVGHGGMGVVYRALDTGMDRYVALKALRPGPGQSDLLRNRFLREAQLAARLSHPNIVRVHECSTDKGVTFFTMDLIEGEPLDEVLRRRKILGREGVQMLLPVARAVAHAHERGVIHRDLKPQNIILEMPTGRPMVMDFGLARGTDSKTLTRSGTTLGTPFYMSPEQVRGHTEKIDNRTDVYSLGIMLYEMITGKLPFVGMNDAETYDRILKHDPVPPRKLDPAISPDLERICLTAIARSRRRRYLSAKEFAGDLQRFLAGDAVRAQGPTLSYIVVRRIQRHRTLAAGTAMFLLAVAAFSVFLLVDWFRTRSQIEMVLEQAREALQERKYEDARTFALRADAADPGNEFAKLYRTNAEFNLAWNAGNYTRATTLLSTVEKKTLWKKIAGTSTFVFEGRSVASAKVGNKEGTTLQLAPGIVSATVLRQDAPPLVFDLRVDPGFDTTITIPDSISGEWRFVPAGHFIFGGAPTGKDRPIQNDRMLRSTDSFLIAEQPITAAQYHAFLDTIQNPLRKKLYTPRSRTAASNPIPDLDLKHARAYCMHYDLRFPTEAEWEKAARGVVEQNYPWGNTFTAEAEDVSPYGVRGMVSGAPEWVQGDSFLLRGGGPRTSNGIPGKDAYRADIVLHFRRPVGSLRPVKAPLSSDPGDEFVIAHKARTLRAEGKGISEAFANEKPAIRIRALFWAEWLGEEGALDQLVAMSKDKSTRYAAAEALLELADFRGFLPRMEWMYEERVRRGERWRVPYSCWSLSGIGYDSKIAGQLLDHRLGGIRIFGIEWISEHGDQSLRKKLETITQKDRFDWVKSAARKALLDLDQKQDKP